MGGWGEEWWCNGRTLNGGILPFLQTHTHTYAHIHTATPGGFPPSPPTPTPGGVPKCSNTSQRCLITPVPKDRQRRLRTTQTRASGRLQEHVCNALGFLSPV